MKLKDLSSFWRGKGNEKCGISRSLALSLCILTFAGAYAQTGKVDIRLNNAPLKTLFSTIEKQTSYRFSYRDADVAGKQNVTVSVENKELKDLLIQELTRRNLTYKMSGNVIMVLPAQQAVLKRITGVVRDSKGEPIIGANITVKGQSSIGTITDIDGRFALDVPSDAVLVVSYIGYVAQDVTVGNQKELIVSLQENTEMLDEVVVVGYGTLNRQAITGAVAKAKIDTYIKVPTNNILETIRGSVPGLNVEGTNAAGQVASFTIRGQKSTSGNSPLIVVDGAIFNGSLGDIPSEDIESFTVLKDASVAAVYGSRSANGVVLIQTKRGHSSDGKPQFNVNLSYGISNQLERLKIYDGPGYIQRLLDYREANGMEADPSKVAMYLTAEEQKNYNATPDHKPTVSNPYDLFTQNAYSMKANLSISNSTDKFNYYISASLTDQKGVILNDQFKNFSGRINLESNITDWLKVGVKSFYSIRDYSGSSPDFLATHFSPYASIYDEEGCYLQYPQSTTSFESPFWSMQTDNMEKRNNLGGVLNAEIKIPWVKGLTYSMVYSNNLRWSQDYYFYDEYTTEGQGKHGKGQRTIGYDYSMMLDNIIKYNNTFNGKHNLDVTLLYSRERNTWDDNQLYAESFDNTVLGHYKLEDGKVQTVNTGGGESGAIGWMARATYTFDNCYSMTGTVRHDGFSAFSKNKKWGTFASAGFNWNVSNESFMRNVKFVNHLNLRLSYGSNGNQSINPYTTLAKVGTDKYLFAGSDTYALTQYISTFATDNLSWETTTGFNAGIDFSVLDNRLSGSIDMYFTDTKDLLFSMAIPDISGKTSIMSNLGKIKNKGVEISLHSVNIQTKDFRWTSDFAFSLNRNKVATIFGDDNDGDGKEDDLPNSGYFIGKSLGTIYGYKVDGMWQQEDVDNGTIMEGMRPGDYKLQDVDGDGAISSDKDRQILGTSKENFRWSFTNTFQYKDLSLMLYFNSVWGGNGYYLASSTPYFDGYVNRGDLNHPVYDYWTPTNTDAFYPRIDYKDNASYTGTLYLDRSFIKLQKVSLSYDLSRYVRPMGIHNLSLTLSADNLWTFAPHWKGLDPETGQGLNDESRPSIRTYLLTLMFNF